MPPAAGAGPQRPGGKAVRLGVRVSESRMPGRGAARASSPLLKYFKLLSDRDCHGRRPACGTQWTVTQRSL